MKYAIFPDMEAMAATALINQGVCDGKVYSSRPKDASEKLPIAIVQRLGGLPTERHPLTPDEFKLMCGVGISLKHEGRLKQHVVHSTKVKV